MNKILLNIFADGFKKILHLQKTKTKRQKQ